MAVATSDNNDKNTHSLPPQVVLAEDPSANVKDLVKEVVIRIDALREAERRRFDDLREADKIRIDDILELRAFYAEKLEVAEAKRIDAIRLVDTNAVAIATQRAGEQAAVLASQVAASAEALRLLVASTAQTQKQQSDQSFSQLSDRISVVERFQYEGRGSAGNISPALADQLSQLGAAVSALKEKSDRGEGRGGISQTMLIAIAVAVTGLVSFILQRLMTGGL